jgi:integrase
VAQVTAGYDPVGRKQVLKRAVRPTQAAALEALDTLRAEQRDKPALAPPQSDMTVKVFADLWMASKKAAVAPLTYLRYELDVGYVTRFLGNEQLASLAAWSVSQFYNRMNEVGYSTDAQRKAGTRLRQMLKDAQRMSLTTHNVAFMVPLPRHVEAVVQVWTPRQAARDDRLYALYHVALDTGAREGELFALEWSDFDPGKRRLRFTKALEEKEGRLRVKELKTRTSLRSVTLSREAAEALLAHYRRMEDEGHGSAVMFPTQWGRRLRRPNLRQRSFGPLVEKAGVPLIRCHDMRHTAATLMLLGGVDIKTVAARIGHSRPAMLLKRYAHVLPTMQRKAAAVMGRLLSGRDEEE